MRAGKDIKLRSRNVRKYLRHIGEINFLTVLLIFGLSLFVIAPALHEMWDLFFAFTKGVTFRPYGYFQFQAYPPISHDLYSYIAKMGDTFVFVTGAILLLLFIFLKKIPAQLRLLFLCSACSCIFFSIVDIFVGYW